MPSSDDSVALDSWANRLTAPPIPVRAETIQELELLRAREDRVDANSLGEVVASDPLMTLRVMAHVASLRRPHQQGEPQTVTAALVWLGIAPFFRSIHELRSVEQALESYPATLQQMEHRLTINHRAARLALAFASERGEPNAPLLHHAALLHEFQDLLFLVHEPAAAQQIEAMQDADRAISRAEAQRQVLGIALSDLRQPISRLLRLPRILDYSDSSSRTEHPSARCIEFALDIARRDSRAGMEYVPPGSNGADMEALMNWLDVSESRLFALISDAGS
jgi:hypothetical protein